MPIYCVSMTMPVILIVTITIIIVIIIIIVGLRSACNLTFYFVLAMNTEPELLSRVGGWAGGFPCLLWACSLATFIGNNRKMRPKESPSCSIPHLLIAYPATWRYLSNSPPEHSSSKDFFTVCKKVYLTLTIKTTNTACF